MKISCSSALAWLALRRGQQQLLVTWLFVYLQVLAFGMADWSQFFARYSTNANYGDTRTTVPPPPAPSLPPSPAIEKGHPEGGLSMIPHLCMFFSLTVPTPLASPQVLPLGLTACSLRHCSSPTPGRSTRSTRPDPASLCASPPSSGHGFPGKNVFFFLYYFGRARWDTLLGRRTV